jgi:ATP-dependent DNA helicase
MWSQMTKMLDLIESFLEQQGHKACRIDGSVPWQERQQNITSFNQDEVC